MNCKTCGEPGEFYSSSPRVCKECVKRRAREYRANNLPRVQEYDRRRARENPTRRVFLFEKLKNLVETKPTARRAHIIVGNAIRDRRLIRKPCEVCVTGTPVVAHHDDYLRPLDVRWLCQSCHVKWHNENGPGVNFDAPVPEEWNKKKKQL